MAIGSINPFGAKPNGNNRNTNNNGSNSARGVELPRTGKGMIMEFRRRADLGSMKVYKQGKPAPSQSQSLKLSSNENPFGPLPSVVKAIEEQTLGTLNRYPDMRGWRIVERIADKYGVGADNVILGNGSGENIKQLIEALAGPGDEVVFPWPSFQGYPVMTACAGATPVEVPLTKDLRHDIDALIAAVTPRTRLMIVNNPNNPTSTSVSKEEAERLIEGVPDDLIVLFDEAYFQFNTDPDASVAMDLFDAHPNVAVAHTFSKAYGLAGLRIGYCIAHEDVISEMMKARLPFSVTDMAQVAAVASMDAQDELDERVRAIVAERGRVVDAIRAMGWFLPEPEGNFFWVPLREQTAQAAQAFDEAKISVRVTPGEGLRITIGSKEANDAVIAIFEALNAQGVRSVR